MRRVCGVDDWVEGGEAQEADEESGRARHSNCETVPLEDYLGLDIVYTVVNGGYQSHLVPLHVVCLVVRVKKRHAEGHLECIGRCNVC